MHLGHWRGDCVRGLLWQLTWKPLAQLSQIDKAPTQSKIVFPLEQCKKLPGCLHETQVFPSGEELVGLTLSIVSPLGRLGIGGKGANADFDEEALFPLGIGGEVLSFFFLTAWRVFGGETEEYK